MKPCPCGSKKLYRECCGIYISGKAVPPTPEALMRSRYTAYSEANIDYIVHTMKGRAIQNYDKEEAKSWAKKVRWLGLDVISSKTDLMRGWVEFIAYYSEHGLKQTLQETSEFFLEDGKWYYIDGIPSHKKS